MWINLPWVPEFFLVKTGKFIMAIYHGVLVIAVRDQILDLKFRIADQSPVILKNRRAISFISRSLYPVALYQLYSYAIEHIRKKTARKNGVTSLLIITHY